MASGIGLLELRATVYEISASYQSWVRDDGGRSALEELSFLVGNDNDHNFYAGESYMGDNYRNFFAFRLPTLDGEIVSAQMLWRKRSPEISSPSITGHDVERAVAPTGPFRLYSIETPVDAFLPRSAFLALTAQERIEFFQDAGSGLLYSSRQFTPDDNYSPGRPFHEITMDLSGEARGDIYRRSGNYFVLGGSLETDPFNGRIEYVFAGSEPGGNGEADVTVLRLVTSVPTPDGGFNTAGLVVLLLMLRIVGLFYMRNHNSCRCKL